MSKLEHVDADALRDVLATVESAKATKRLVVALSYKDGVAVSRMADRYGIPRSTLYYWLDRFEEHPIPEAIEDETRPGRPPKLDADHRATLERHLAASPAEHGYDASAWSSTLVRRHIEREFGVTYSDGHVRRLRRELGDE
jgi:transposase